MAYPVFVFDWDGTLVDSESHIVASLEFASRRLGLPLLAYDCYKDIIGLGMREALHALYPELSDADIELMRQQYAEYFFENEMTEKNLFEGVVSTLEELKARGRRLAVATGKSRNGLDKALRSTGLGGFFEVERCADETRSKPHPMMLEEICHYFNLPVDQMVMVGDTEYDMEMASNISMAAIGVSYGVHATERLYRYAPVTVIDKFNELLELKTSR